MPSETRTWSIGTIQAVPITVTGGRWPVHAVTLTLNGSNQPATYYLVREDARGTLTYAVGPLTKIGRFQMSIAVSDERGCEATLAAPWPIVTVTK